LSKSIQILTVNANWNEVQTPHIRDNRARDTPLWGIYIPNFGKISVLGVLYPYCCTDGSEIWHGGLDPHRCLKISLWV